MNHTHAPFGELKVRQALNYAIDRRAINQAVYAGTGETPNNELPKLEYNDNRVPKYTFNLAKAKQLLAQSSVPDGFSAGFLIPAGAAHDKQLALLLQQQWKKLGVNINIQEVDQAALRDRHQKYDYDMLIPQPLWFSDVLVPDEFAFVFADTSKNGIDGILLRVQERADLEARAGGGRRTRSATRTSLGYGPTALEQRGAVGQPDVAADRNGYPQQCLQRQGERAWLVSLRASVGTVTMPRGRTRRR